MTQHSAQQDVSAGAAVAAAAVAGHRRPTRRRRAARRRRRPAAAAGARPAHATSRSARACCRRTVGYVKAVDGVSFDVQPGKTLGLVGESGCGKTTVGRTILRLIPATAGEVRYKGEDFFAYRGEELRRLRRQMQIIFQDPVSSLNPRMTVGNIIGEPIEVHGIARGREKRRHGREPAAARRARSVLRDAATRTNSPAASGSASASPGRWRSPPTSSSATSRSARWTSRSSRRSSTCSTTCRRERNIAYLFIAHNLAVVEHFSDEVAVMYLGRIVEKAEQPRAVREPQASLHDGAAVAPSPSPTRGRRSAGSCSRAKCPVAVQPARPAAPSTRAAR